MDDNDRPSGGAQRLHGEGGYVLSTTELSSTATVLYILYHIYTLTSVYVLYDIMINHL